MAVRGLRRVRLYFDLDRTIRFRAANGGMKYSEYVRLALEEKEERELRETELILRTKEITALMENVRAAFDEMYAE